MCGIIGCVGFDNSIEHIKNGLLYIEYRGYDSAGISYFDQDFLVTEKRVGNVKNLFDSIDVPLNVMTAIGHTRWATHGIVSERNAHPQISFDGNFTLVHNGIIENNKKIKEGLLKDVSFKSETDTESIVNLIAYYYQKSQNTLLAIKETCKLLKGSFAIAILHKGESDTIYYARKTSPLLVGKNQNGSFLASDVVGFGKLDGKYAIVNNESLGFIKKDEIKAYSFDNKELELIYDEIADNDLMIELGSHKHFMEKEINEDKEAIINTAKLYFSENSPFSALEEGYLENIKKVEFIACGTSYHASLFGSKLLEEEAKIISRSHIASEFIYNPPILENTTLCVFVSQSGETADTLKAIEVAKENKAKTIAVTNVITSNIARCCDYTFRIMAGSEIAVASTKAYNSQVVVMLLLVKFLANKDYRSLAERIIKYTEKINMKDMWKKAQEFYPNIDNVKQVYFVGRHKDYITAMESSLKLKEISYIPSEAYLAGELKHGTLALVEEGTIIIAIITEKDLLCKTENVVEQAKSRGAKALYITPFKELLAKNINPKFIFEIPYFDEDISELYSIIPMQMVSYLVCINKGYDPDKPRNLAKSVTVE